MRTFRILLLMWAFLQPITSFAQRGPYLKKGEKATGYKWELIYNDNFTSHSTIDRNWIAQNSAPDHIKSSRWRDNLTTRWGKLVISNRKETKGGKEWTSGSMHCSKNMCYGYYECRMRISKATGINNSFWMMSAGKKKGQHDFEIDFVEAHYPNIINMTIHDWGADGEKRLPSVSQEYKPDVDLSAGYHIYGCNWEEDEISFYFDGELVWKTENIVCDHAGPMVLGTAVLGWAGETTEAIDGTDMRVDYVRVWKKKKQ